MQLRFKNDIIMTTSPFNSYFRISTQKYYSRFFPSVNLGSGHYLSSNEVMTRVFHTRVRVPVSNHSTFSSIVGGIVGRFEGGMIGW